MSHFTVAVVTDAPEDVDAVLLPFHEFECTGAENEYVQDVDITNETLAEYEKNKDDYDSPVDAAGSYWGIKAVPHGDEPDIAGAHKYGYVLVDENGGLVKAVNRTNPNAKWDWYSIGGRWSGMLKTKKGAAGVKGMPGLMGAQADPNGIDQCRIEDLDLEGMLAESIKERGAAWDEAERKFLDACKTEGVERDLEASITAFNAGTDRLIAEMDAGKHEGENLASLIEDDEELYLLRNLLKGFLGFWGKSEMLEYGTRKKYVDAALPFSTYAYLKDGEWVGSGDMGWWGMSSNQKDAEDWGAHFKEMLQSLPAEKVITIVDCHI